MSRLFRRFLLSLLIVYNCYGGEQEPFVRRATSAAVILKLYANSGEMEHNKPHEVMRSRKDLLLFRQMLSRAKVERVKDFNSEGGMCWLVAFDEFGKPLIGLLYLRSLVPESVIPFEMENGPLKSRRRIISKKDMALVVDAKLLKELLRDADLL